ncbi:uncharacterized protein LOC122084458 [Macadamia integrifolia]|uniref:uncharacterized protein LOC122084458 n=1 Tax=Macadamia integrifolia TaxID=60698 RepID=UPI001C4F9AF0|nr:uncharacterized protein LOC122084458 [Macadamia integrifolia]
MTLDANGRTRRFRETKTKSGWDRFITLKEFNHPTNGYLVNDTSVFGAEVFVHKESVAGKGECLLMTAGPVSCNHTWKIEKFSELANECHSSEVFIAGCHKWRISLYPNGNGEAKGKSLSLFLLLDGCCSCCNGFKIGCDFLF